MRVPTHAAVATSAETAHAIAWVADNAGRWAADAPVLICLSGRGDKDVAQLVGTDLLDA